jgi:hypothetical protein
MLVSVYVKCLNKKILSVAIWINDAKEDLVIGPAMQLLPRFLETPCLLFSASSDDS